MTAKPKTIRAEGRWAEQLVIAARQASKDSAAGHAYLDRLPDETDDELDARIGEIVMANLAEHPPEDPASPTMMTKLHKLYLTDQEFRFAWHNGNRSRDPLQGWRPALRRDAEPPTDRFEVLCGVEPKFDRSFRRRRSDLLDGSDSSCDMSLSIIAFRYGWTTQDVADVIVAGRRLHGARGALEKALRRDYMETTIIRGMLRAMLLPSVPEL